MPKSMAFVKLNREWASSPEWLAEPFDKVRAWMDLFIQASYEDTDELKRGQLLTTERILAKRWQWPKSKVHRYLEELEENGRITRTAKWTAKRTAKWTAVTIEKYSIYQDCWTADWTAERTAKWTSYKEYIKNNKNISLYGDEREALAEEFGAERLEKLEADVRAYYEAHDEKPFPGWTKAVRQFARNQERWGASKGKSRRKSLEEIAAEAFADLEE